MFRPITILRALIVSYFVAALTACGGGGGGNGDESSTPSQISQSIVFTNAGPINLFVGEALINTASGPGSGAVSYSSSNAAAITVNSTTGLVTAINAGSAVITASKAADTHYLAATASYTISATVITPVSQSLVFTNTGPVTLVLGDTLTNLASGPGSGSVSYTSNNTAVATVNSTTGLVTAISSGSAVITATKAADAHYLVATASYTINTTVVAPVSQSIVFADAGPVSLAIGSTLANTVSGAGSGVVTYTSNNPSIASVNSTTGVVTAVSFGSAVITATKTADAHYLGATASYTVNTTRISQAFTFNAQGTVSASVDNIWSNTASGQGSGVVSYSSSDTSVVTVHSSSGVATAVGGGSATITATKAADLHYLAAITSYTVNVARLNQTITFTNEGPVSVSLGDTFANSAAGPGSGAVTYSSDNSAVSTVDSTGLVTAVGFGSAVITATKAADSRYSAATASYTVNSVAGFTAWIGSTNTQVNFSSAAYGMEFYRSREFNCNLAQYASCIAGQMDILSGAQVTDSAATLSQVGYYVLKSGSHQSNLTVSTAHFSGRLGHALVTYNNELWLIGGIDNINGVKNDVWSSGDGINWKLRSSSAAFSARSSHQVVVYNNKLWLIGGYDGTTEKNDVWSSTDGVTWAQQSFGAAFSARQRHQVTVYNNQMWLTGGYDGVNQKNDVWSSSDGILWTLKTSAAAFYERSDHQVVAYNNQLWLIGGTLSDSGYVNVTNDVWSSSDGVTWTQQVTTAPIFAARRGHQVKVYKNQLWLTGGWLGGNFYSPGEVKNDVWVSSDGIHWTQKVAEATFSRREGHQMTVFNNLLYVIGGGYNIIQYGAKNGEVWTSSDGIIWKEQSIDADITLQDDYQMVSFNNKLWLIGGQKNIYSSSDGINWVLQTATAAFSKRSAHRVVVYQNKLWLIGGSDNNYQRLNDIWSSVDGVVWTLQTAAAAFSPREDHQVIIYNGKMWLIGGEDGCCASNLKNDIWSSTDGITWTPQTTAAAFSGRYGHQALVFQNQMWVIGGEAMLDPAHTAKQNDVWASSDGVNWTQKTAAAAFSARAVHRSIVHGNQLWVIGGNSDTSGGYVNDVWSSNDGVVWTQKTAAAPFSPRVQHRLAVLNNNLYLHGGFDNNSSAKKDAWSSSDGVEWHKGYRGSFTFP